MKKAATNPMETLQMWDEICREFGCSEEQVSELYSLPCPAAAPETESYEEVMKALTAQPSEWRPPVGFLVNEKQN
jgi:hypothetical protein